ncbi:MAG TPA: CDC48 family AAA ATPase [Thermomicrobiales bacterium]|nr:CDC48 family AAA ATPase [Thermomicrobiales bacterium]
MSATQPAPPAPPAPEPQPGPGECLLRVAEAASRDADRGIVRLDPADLAALGGRTGDLLLITGGRPTVAKALPAFLPDRGRGLVQLDGVTRDNARVALGERALVRVVGGRPAGRVVLRAIGGRAALSGQDARYIGHLLEGYPLLAGDRVRVNLFGPRPQDFQVVETEPAGPVLVTGATSLRLAGNQAPDGVAAITYEDIGGLGKEVRRIREMIELPLRYPQLFQRLGIEPPKGVLLHGPPGTGKTLIARAVAYETAAHFFHVNGPELINKFYGQSEANLRSMFEEAERRAPSIIFIDEIDAIAPKRVDVYGEVEKRVVAQLLGLLDGLQARGQVIVIGATNIPDALDPALRRPGRFDRELTIGVPDRPGRREILEIHTRGMPLAADVDLERLAGLTHGFVGADIAALCREAAMVALRRILPTIDFALATIPYEQLAALEVRHQDFVDALREVSPSALREVFTETPDVTWADIGGLDDVKEALIEAVEWPLRYGALFDRLGAAPPRGILLEGPPGTGKTLLARAVAHESEANFIAIKGPEVFSKWVGESERGVREIFKKARAAAPCVLFFDELDALAPPRGEGWSDGVSDRLVGQFLTELDGLEELQGVIVLGATNRADMLDPALLRPGRFDLTIALPLPDAAAREAIFAVHLRGRPLAADVDPRLLARETEGLSGADIAGLCRQAAMLAIRDAVAVGAAAPDDLRLDLGHFAAACEQLGFGALDTTPVEPARPRRRAWWG